MPDTIITGTGSAYFRPILDLAERMLQKPAKKLVAGRIGGLENGYGASPALHEVQHFRRRSQRLNLRSCGKCKEVLVGAPRLVDRTLGS